MPAGGKEPVEGLVDHLFRREAGRMVASLVRSFGPAHLDLAEEVVQEAMMKALRIWPYHGLPQRPAAWLYRVANNLALDRLRRRSSFRSKEPMLRAGTPRSILPGDPPALAGELTDDQLGLIFLCCHPDLPRDGRVALTLRYVAGFSVGEIARAFLAKETTIAQRLVRAQRRIQERGIPFEVPGPEELPPRLEAVLEALYLLFNEGYAAHDGDDLVRADLCAEAIRLVEQLALLPATARPQVHALAALLQFQASRLPARTDGRGELLRLEEQDRSRWDRAAIAAAFGHLDRAAAGSEETTYHLQAAIAAQHAAATSEAGTDWPEIRALYDRLLQRHPSPVVALNRAVAISRVQGPAAGLRAIRSIEEAGALRDYYLLHATRAELLERSGDRTAAAAAWSRALDCPCSRPERRFLERRLSQARGHAG